MCCEILQGIEWQPGVDPATQVKGLTTEQKRLILPMLARDPWDMPSFAEIIIKIQDKAFWEDGVDTTSFKAYKSYLDRATGAQISLPMSSFICE
jgi:hypothetical protein